eukprot:202857-Rhodomonas_salina.1
MLADIADMAARADALEGSRGGMRAGFGLRCASPVPPGTAESGVSGTGESAREAHLQPQYGNI